VASNVAEGRRTSRVLTSATASSSAVRPGERLAVQHVEAGLTSGAENRPVASFAVEKSDMGQASSQPGARFASHSLVMNDAGRLTFKIIRDPDANHRFRWLIYDEGRAVAYSPNSFATRREAEADVGKAMLKIVVRSGGA
jgi:hypothetical protein